MKQFLHNFYRSAYFEWLIILLPISIMFIGWFMPGIIIGGDFQYRPHEFFQDLCHFDTWQTNLSGGDYSIYNAQLTKLPIFYVSCVFSSFLSYEILSRIMWLFPILIVGTSGMYILTKYIWKDYRMVRIFSTLFFMLNPTFLERLYRAHVWMTFVYTLIPWILLFVYKAIKKRSYVDITIASILISVAVWYEVRTALLVIIMAILFAIVYLMYNFSKSLLGFYGKAGLISFCIGFLLNAYWIIPTLWYPPQTFYDSSLLSVPALIGAGKYTGSLLQAWHLTPLSWSNIYFPASIMIIILFLTLFLWKWKKKELWLIVFLGLTTLLFTFLGKGTFPPFSNLYVWLELNVPFFIGYRVSSKFLLVGAFSLALIFGLAIQRLTGFRGKHFSSHNWNISIVILAIIIICSNSIFMITGYREQFGNEMGADYQKKYKNEQNMFWPTTIESYYVELWDYIKQYNESGKRVIWFPKVNRYRLASEEHPQISSNTTFYYEEPLVKNIIGPKGLLMNTNFHRLDMFMNLFNSEHIVVRPAHEQDWNYSNSQPYYKLIAALNNQYYLKQEFLSGTLPYKIVNMDQIDWSTNGEISYVKDNFFPGETLVEYTSGHDQTFLLAPHLERIPLEEYGFISFWIKGSIPETISIQFTDTDGRIYDTYTKVNGNLEWQNVTLPLDTKLTDIDSIKIYSIIQGNKLTLSPFILEPAGLRLYKTETLAQDMQNLEMKQITDYTKLSEWQTKGDISSKTINTGFGEIEVLDYYSSDFNTFMAKNFANPVKLEDYDTMFFWIKTKREENIEFLVKDSNDNIQKRTIRVAGGNTWEPIFFIFEPIITDIEVIQMKGIITTNELQLTPIHLAKTNIIPYESNVKLDKFYFSDINIHVPDQELFQCFQVQYKNIPANYAILGEDLPEGLPYNEVNSCLNWYYLEDIIPSTINFSVESDSNVSHKVSLDANLPKDSLFVFNDSYSNYWSLKVDGNYIKNHVPVNGYSNGWVIPKGAKELELYFKPQSTFLFGLIVSALSMLTMLGFIIFKRLQRR